MTAPHVVVLGLMGIGKSTTAIATAAALGWGSRDSDLDIERTYGRSGRKLAEDRGVPYLHRLEAAMLIGALASQSPTVISAAASTVEHEECAAALARRAFTVVLTTDLDTVVARAATGAHRRPLARAELEALHRRRAPLFAEVADLTLDAAAPTTDLVDQILSARTHSGSVPVPVENPAG